jgi:protein-tyrosine phosphatase
VTFRIPLDVPGTLAITPRPRGGDWLRDDIQRLGTQGVSMLVSLLTRREQQELGLEDEPAVCAACGVEFVSVPVADLGVPENARSFTALVARLATALQAKGFVAVHCRQSVGRSGLLATSIAVALGVPLGRAIEVISAARGVRVPETPGQMAWLREHEARLAAGLRSDGGDHPPDEHDLKRQA